MATMPGVHSLTECDAYLSLRKDLSIVSARLAVLEENGGRQMNELCIQVDGMQKGLGEIQAMLKEDKSEDLMKKVTEVLKKTSARDQHSIVSKNNLTMLI
jgi:hypothetical protein